MVKTILLLLFEFKTFVNWLGEIICDNSWLNSILFTKRTWTAFKIYSSSNFIITYLILLGHNFILNTCKLTNFNQTLVTNNWFFSSCKKKRINEKYYKYTQGITIVIIMYILLIWRNARPQQDPLKKVTT